jgi:hypothetical protein
MSGESLLELAVCHAPHFEGLVPRPGDELPRIRRIELEAGDEVAAIFSNVSFTCYFNTPLPPLNPGEGGKGRRKNRYCNGFTGLNSKLHEHHHPLRKQTR